MPHAASKLAALILVLATRQAAAQSTAAGESQPPAASSGEETQPERDSSACPRGTWVYHLGSHCCRQPVDRDGKPLTYESTSCYGETWFKCPGGEVDYVCSDGPIQTGEASAARHVVPAISSLLAVAACTVARYP
eukprot:gnl/TRDRNA2_/TRDRNA2_56970_c0_seq1.p1 gnl/TRDRNA2_/TRDRNA2_56970_c0~~gnl/TRDRNA2_/TRDRNA2_56970_c0_seq1.p1  ORF type:complete len:135 (-),score=14.08 gnl/TRDRNA2_/TRDRNA2_56970_c0_seq1:398-802(-)